MKIIRNLESFFENYIEGFFNRKFSSGLQPVEIAKQLVKCMENQRSVGISLIYVPNQYSVYINKEDYERLIPYGEAIQQELSSYVADEAKHRHYTIVGQPIIDLFLDEDLERGKFRITCSFSEPLPTDEPAVDTTGPQPLSDTRVFGKINFVPEKRSTISGVLTVIDGLDSGTKVDIGTTRVNIGRREGNELPLTDMNTSRLHAYLLYEDGGHVLIDAKSLNGTYVNGHRITRKRLQNGDRIKIGNTTVLYEVK